MCWRDLRETDLIGVVLNGHKVALGIHAHVRGVDVVDPEQVWRQEQDRWEHGKKWSADWVRDVWHWHLLFFLDFFRNLFLRTYVRRTADNGLRKTRDGTEHSKSSMLKE